jgi:5,10-methylenetetrahydromethanopterin reductase
MLRPALYDKCSAGAIPKPGTDAIVSVSALFPNIAQETHLPDDLIQQVRAAFHHGGPEAAAAYINDEVVEYLTASGTPAECRRKIEAYRAAGVQLPILFPVDPNVHLAIETLGPLP